jgi:hypothetical protein
VTQSEENAMAEERESCTAVHLALGHLNPGRTTTPATVNSLMNGLEERVLGRLPDATRIYPGYGGGNH